MKPKSNDEIREKYNHYYYKHDMYERSNYFYIWLVGLLKPEPGKKLLDVSCGEGHLLRQAEKAGLNTTGIDISEVALKKAKPRLETSKTSRGNAEALEFPDNTFDYVTNIGSLEHYLNSDLAVREMARVLRPDGKCIILVPNRYYWKDIWRAFRKGRGQLPTEQGLEHTDSREGWKDLFEENGLRVESVIKYERVAKKRFWQREAPRCMVLHHRLVPLNLCFSFVYLLRKKNPI